MSVEFRVDETSKKLVKVTEAETTEEELRADLKAAADEAQNRLNAANDAKVQADANLVAATEAVDAADAEVEAAQTEVGFSTARLAELDDAVAVLAGLDESGTEETSPEDSEAVEVPTHTAEVAPA